MDAGAELTVEESGHLARILLTATRVSQRHHFFSWVHGPLQALIPHEILLCGVADENGQLLHEVFTACRYFRSEHFERVCHPLNGLLPQLAQDWQVQRQPRLIAPVAGDDWHARLIDLELKNLTYHGMRSARGQFQGYASFSRVGVPFDARLELMLEILLPTVLATLSRVLANESGEQVRGCHSGILTPREIDVLHWVRDGKTNDEIAASLGVSMHTVKNHLRNCMKKLHVRTRGQAVTQAIALGVLKLHGTDMHGTSAQTPDTYASPAVASSGTLLATGQPL